MKTHLPQTMPTGLHGTSHVEGLAACAPVIPGKATLSHIKAPTPNDLFTQSQLSCRLCPGQDQWPRQLQAPKGARPGPPPGIRTHLCCAARARAAQAQVHPLCAVRAKSKVVKHATKKRTNTANGKRRSEKMTRCPCTPSGSQPALPAWRLT